MNWMLALPEIVLACAGLAILMIGVLPRQNMFFGCTMASIGALVVTAALVLTVPDGTGFSGQVISDGFARFMKLLVLLGAAIGMLMALDFNTREGLDRFEYPVLLLFATLGMLIMLSANDFMTVYIGLELLSLSLYVVAAFHRDNEQSAEAGLKYFVLGALASGLFLYGASLVYGFAGTTSFERIAQALLDPAGRSQGLTVGLIFILAGLAFKVSAVPFHMWTPDVYEGAPTPVTAFFAAAPKVAAIALLVRVLAGPFGELAAQWQQVIILMSLASMVLGSLAAIGQRDIKRLMAYSSIGHVGYALMGLAVASDEGLHGLTVYMAIYLAMNLGAFAVLIAMRRQGKAVSVGVLGNAAEVFPDLVRRGIRPDVVTDQTSAHDPLNGYLPAGWTLAEWEERKLSDPAGVTQAAKASMAVVASQARLLERVFKANDRSCQGADISRRARLRRLRSRTGDDLPNRR